MRDLINILSQYAIKEFTFVDVGAKDALEFIPEISSVTNLHAFEPNPKECEKLKEIYRQHSFKTLHINKEGLGEKENQALFKLTQHASMSSILEPDMGNYVKHFGSYKEFKDWEKKIKVESEIIISIQTIDRHFKYQSIDYLKIDTQGSELSILKGAKQLIENKKVHVIKVEVSIIPIYKNQALFSDIDLFLRRYNYVLVDFVTYRNDYIPLFKSDQGHSHYAPCGDAIYVLEDEPMNLSLNIKKGLIIQWLGYQSLASTYFNNAGLTKEIITHLQSIKKITYLPFYKRLFKNIIPPLLYRLTKHIIWRLKK